ncbi:MAG TPA: DUF4389 domain-containing protein [Dehalococcoidia bacterium]|nr:DUF4389 domain-containing protein [Dehalococcoidia bacterium]
MTSEPASAAAASVQAPQAYPIRVTVALPEKSSRLLNFPLFIGTFIRYILMIPHMIVIALVGLVAVIVYFIATFAILFTGRFPAGMFRFVAGWQRWSTSVGAYFFGLADAYPPFSTEQAGYPVVYEADYTDKSNRILNFPLFGLYIKELLLIPHLFVLAALALIGFVVLFVAQFAVLFTGQFPAGMHNYLAGVLRWSTRLNGYIYALTDRYPPFSLN